MLCDICHRPLAEARLLIFAMAEDCMIPGHVTRAHAQGRNHDQLIVGRRDGLACTRCDHFEPYASGSPSAPPTTTRAART